MKYLIPDRHSFRANLHCHTTCSDGQYSPQEIKDLYRSLGISIVAFSDHRNLVDQSSLSDDSFLALNAFEYDVPAFERNSPWFWNTLIHIGMIARSPESRLEKPIAVEPPDTFPGSSVFEQKRNCLIASVNAAVRQARAQNFLCILNHPKWSFLSVGDSLEFQGMLGVEVYNHASSVNTGIREGDAFYNQWVSELVRTHAPHPFPFAIATDDNHARNPVGHRDCNNGGGWLELFSNDLTYPSVISAIETGSFYASSGATIKFLEYDPDNRMVHVRCSPAAVIRIFSRGRASKYLAAEPGCAIEEATFHLDPQSFHSFFRIRIEGIDGNEAWSNCYPI